jgi:holo-[acyl-carrier protein] synthase
MIKSIGIDLVALQRIDADIAKFGERFIEKILGHEEQQIFAHRNDKAIFLAGRFAAKEAIVKGLGKYLANRPALSSIQILNDDSGFPEVSFPDSIRNALGKSHCHISISHDHSNAVAVAIFEETA